jgi:hypothetical protein
MQDTGSVDAPGEALREVSAELFGRALRLPLAAWVRAQPGPFFQRQAAEGIEAPQTYVRKELATLVRVGMVHELPRSDGDIRVFYEQAPDHPWWAIIDTASRAAQTSRP